MSMVSEQSDGSPILTEKGKLPSREEFSEWVHDALNRLYDSPYLGEHPLRCLLTEEEIRSPERAQYLRRLLLSAIRDLRPSPGAPADSPDWRGYRILELRHVEGLGPAEAMRELSLGRSQFFREQKHILDALSDRLWEAWQRTKEVTPTTLETRDSRAALFSSAVEQLASQAMWEPINPTHLWAELGPLIEALARVEQVGVTFAPDSVSDCIETDRVLLRQAVLDVFTNVLPAAHGGRVQMRCFTSSDESAGLQIDVMPAEVNTSQPHEVNPEVARRLMTVMGGALRVTQAEDGGWQVQLAWPAGRPILFVIDDNEEFTDLYRRFLAGRNWRVIGAASGREALARLTSVRPTVILLDVLMPSEDGWELLVTLKSREDTRDIPVIVCSVLDQPGLALALGAAGYLAKPVTQRELMRALAPWRRALAIT